MYDIDSLHMEEFNAVGAGTRFILEWWAGGEETNLEGVMIKPGKLWQGLEQSSGWESEEQGWKKH
jgi:hypothetical protein